jgi:hypothetical protein
MLALIRGIGMLVAAISCALPMFTTIANRSILLWGVAIGFLMIFGTLAFDDWLKRRR